MSTIKITAGNVTVEVVDDNRTAAQLATVARGLFDHATATKINESPGPATGFQAERSPTRAVAAAANPRR